MSLVWLEPELVEAIHEELLAEHGGAEGIRDSALLDSALSRPKLAAGYKDHTIFELAGMLLVALVQNHPFVDGNKRVGFVATYTFLGINGYELRASEAEAYLIVLDVASGQIDEQGTARWLEDNCITS